jgi:KDO2-lipid IV(A) lauroyltransferase
VNNAPPVRWIFSSSPERKAAARRHWIQHPFIGLLKTSGYYLMRVLPTDWGSGFGAMMSRLSPGDYPESDARARRLWQTLRPEASDPASTDAAMRRLWRHVGRTAAEIAILDRLWGEGRIQVEGAEHLAAPIDAKKPLLAAAIHLGNWEVISVTGIMLGYHGASLALILENRFEQRRIRESFGGRMIHATSNSGRAIVRELRERPVVIYIDDFARGRVHAPAFGRPLKPEGNIAYVVRLAKITGAAIVPAYCLRLNDEPRFKVTFLPAVALVDTGDPEGDLMANIVKLNALIEPIIRANLDQWFYALDFEFDS